jgi:hypothetical protein
MAMDGMTVEQPLVGTSDGMEVAAETMLAASRNMMAAASALSSGLWSGGAREKDTIAEAIEAGFLRALRRDSLLGEGAADLVRGPVMLPGGGGIQGAGYGRMGASITGQGQRAQLYGTIGGAIGYAVGGPVGALLGGMLGGLLGGDDSAANEQARQEELQRQWLNTPEGFEIEAYLYNMAQAYRMTDPLVSAAKPRGLSWWGSAYGLRTAASLVVQMAPGAVQITGQGAEAGERAAREFAGALGRVLRLNSVVVPAAGYGGDV